MLEEFYQKLDVPEIEGKNILLPESSREAIYISEYGELFCYCGIYERDIKDRQIYFNSWPYYIHNKHTFNYEKDINGLFRIKNGCILLTGFVDHKFYNNKKYKQLSNYIMRLPEVNNCYFGIKKRVEEDNAWHFKEDKELTRACFGLTYSELEYLVKLYAKSLGEYYYIQYPRVTRTMKNDNFCDLTGLWIPPKFPYITFKESGYDFSHVSLYGFYRYIGALVSIEYNTLISQIFNSDQHSNEIIEKIKNIDDYFPFEIKVTREYIEPETYLE